MAEIIVEQSAQVISVILDVPPVNTLTLARYRAISAWDAHRIGLVEEVVKPRQLMAAAYELAETIAKKSPLGLRTAKKALNRVEFMPTEEGYKLEQRESRKLMHTEDAREAARAVVEERQPIFLGR